MQPISVIRAASWLGVVLTGWSINVRWGADALVRNGAPPQFERHVVGAALLAAIAAVLLAFAGPARPRRRRLAGVALGFAVGAHAVAWWVRAIADQTGQPQLTVGTGWTWMATGTALSAIAAMVAVALPGAPSPGKGPRR